MPAITPDEMMRRVRKLHATEIGMGNYQEVLKEAFYVMYQMAVALKEVEEKRKVPAGIAAALDLE